MSRIDRIRYTVRTRQARKAERDPAGESGGAATTVNLPVAVAPVAPVRSFREERRPVESEVVAQLLGQHGERRGLRAGPSAIEAARAAYNRVKWSGSYDRRARKGGLARTDI